MEIQWHGLSCFTVKGKNGTVVTDPFDSAAAGMKLPKFSTDVVLANVDFPLHHNIGGFGKEVTVFEWPGEYEAKGIIIQGVLAYDRPRDKDDEKKDAEANKVIIYTMQVDGFRVCNLSNLGHKLTTEMIDAIGNVDVLLIPVGGNGCLDAKKAHEVIEQLEPRIVIPMYYNVEGSKQKLAPLNEFLKEIGLHDASVEKSFKVSALTDLPQERTEFKILELV
jgi:L-ascorbate metabolism protein UlaG (beta-lactamase superfamily)